MFKSFVSFISRENIDILVLDQANKNFLKDYCFPKNLSYEFIDIDKILFVKEKFFIWNLLRKIISNGLNLASFIAAVVDSKRPKIVISYIDNNPVIQKLGLILPSQKIILIQNGIRINQKHSYGLVAGKAPIIFGYGEIHEKFLNTLNIVPKKFYRVGSLKSGIFLSQISKKKILDDKDEYISFISQYIPKKSQCEFNKNLNQISEKIFKYSLDWCRENKIKLTLIMRYSRASDLYEEELNFFLKLLDIKNEFFSYFAKDTDDLESYHVAFNAKINLTAYSTLGFEIFGIGGKVLFYKGIDDSLDFIPDSLNIEKINKQTIFRKMDSLYKICDKDFLNQTKKIRNNLFAKDKFPAHTVIKNYIKNEISRV